MDRPPPGDAARRRLGPILLGLALTALGTALVLRPFTSARVLVLLAALAALATGAARLAAPRSGRTRADDLMAGAWVIAAVVLVAWPGLSTRGVAVVVGVAMVLGGARDVAASLGGARDERIAGLIGGLASVGFGLLALAWPSITVLVVAVSFGARTAFLGLSLLLQGVRGGARDRVAGPPGRVRRAGHVLRASAALVLAVALGAAGAALNAGEPQLDAFVEQAGEVPGEPGVLLAEEPFERAIPDGARATRIRYTTTRGEGAPALATGLVIVPEGAEGPLPVITWAHGTTGVDRTCAPTLLEEPLESGAFFALDRVLDRGWALVATDYVGLGADDDHPYLVGDATARGVLDAVRAAGQVDGLQLGEDVVVWGHSQGGGVALWAGQIAPGYAPDLAVRGVAALAPASDTEGLVGNLSVIPGGSLFAAYVLQGYAAHYDDVRIGDYVADGARATFEELGGRCLGEPAVLVSLLESLSTGMEVFSQDLSAGPLGARLAENVPTGPFQTPVLIGQGATDPLVLPDVQQAYADRLCAQGTAVDYRAYADRDHVGVVAADSPLIDELLDWTAAVLAGAAPPATCS